MKWCEAQTCAEIVYSNFSWMQFGGGGERERERENEGDRRETYRLRDGQREREKGVEL